ncbi:DoxX family protein [Catenovulum sp. SM1970]|uniref:HvfX family Cu-binding RiPP maturation protein n=1 Tax=Marinifaba aquimaris TaxID=2741323 RepID=UPI001573072F|nr:DoxX family protein [Marinifaba aquimaris]NTS77074.1 DoxX family protein [Marinifaba aquimaris]
MNAIERFYLPLHQLLDKSKCLDGLPLLLLRLYLAPIMIQAGYNKLSAFDSTVQWFGDYLGMPLPGVMAFLAIAAELGGGILLIIGLATRWVSIPLMVTMFVAAFSVHIENGWLAIADGGSWLANDNVIAAQEKLAMAKSILQEYGNYDWLTSSGSFVILNNGIEFAITYLFMLMVLFFYGGGRYVSVDYYLSKALIKKQTD